MRTVQEWIHSLEEGAGARWLRWFVFVMALVALATIYNFRGFKHFSNPEAMDAAQVARNLAEGKGFTTDFIRPAGIYYLKQKTGEVRLNGDHPDLANAPLYPWLLSWWMRVGGFVYEVGNPDAFEAYQPEERIGWFNQFWLILAVLGTWCLASKLFDSYVGWIAAIVVAGSDLLWRYSISGLSTCLMLCLMVLLGLILTAADRRSGKEDYPLLRLAGLAITAGAVTALLGLTRYGMLWMIIPVVAFFSACFQNRGMVLGLLALLGFGLSVAPWLARNHQLSGSPLGTASMVIHENSMRFPGNTVTRLLNPEHDASPRDIRQVGLGEYWHKLDENLPDIIQRDLPGLGGSWIIAFFLVGLLMTYRSRSLVRMRWFTVGSLVLLAVVQALGRTKWGQELAVSADDQMVVLLPFVAVFGVGLFSQFVSQMETTPMVKERIVAPGFVLIMCLPLIVKLVNGEPRRFAYPPYYPPVIQERGQWLDADEMLMSDVPWATAWYGDRASVWIPTEFGAGFVEIYGHKPISAVYLTSLTLDGRLVTEQLRGDDPAFGRFAAEAVLNEEVPEGFPLKHAFAEGFPFQLFLADQPRWLRSTKPEAENLKNP